MTIVLLVFPRLRLRGQNFFLLVASYVFYGFWDWRFNFLLLASTVVDFYVGRKLYATNNQKRRKLLLFVSVGVNLSILGFFKYFNFFLDSAAALASTIGFDPHIPVLRIILPVGISFYTFQTMSYTIDIYRGRLEPTKDFVDFALFVSFFPQLVAGPIERAVNLLPQISNPRSVTHEKILTGLNLVLLGYFKKIAIADTLAPIADKFFTEPGGMTSGQLWTGVYAFSLQIYGDFSGYTDIARGIALILGFHLMKNFEAPYLSRNITEFWRRWHISLSTWLRDYLYIPLGGNRKGKYRTYANLMITMFLGGLWHGAAWNFVIWGVAHGVYLAGERILLRGKKPDLTWPRTIPGWTIDILKILFTFHLVTLTWVLFRSPTFASALVYMRGLFHFGNFSLPSAQVLFAGSLMLALDVVQTWSGSHTWLTDYHGLRVPRYAVAQVLLVSVLAAAVAHIKIITPFIYFQF